MSLRIKDTHGLRVHSPDGKTAATAFMVDSAKLAEILLRAYRNEKLTAAENLRLEGFYRGGLSDMARALREQPKTELPLERWRRIYAVDPRFRVHWDRTRTDFNATFVSFFDELIVRRIHPQSAAADTTNPKYSEHASHGRLASGKVYEEQVAALEESRYRVSTGGR